MFSGLPRAMRLVSLNLGQAVCSTIPSCALHLPAPDAACSRRLDSTSPGSLPGQGDTLACPPRSTVSCTHTSGLSSLYSSHSPSCPSSHRLRSRESLQDRNRISPSCPDAFHNAHRVVGDIVYIKCHGICVCMYIAEAVFPV